MNLLSRAKEALLSRVVEACVAAVMVLLAWVTSIVGPAVWGAISEVVPAQALLPVLLLSVLLNLILGLLLHSATYGSETRLTLLNGIYWDKDRNPFCPVCQKPVVYDSWHTAGWGYYCKPCAKVTPLKDFSGKTLKPEDVFKLK